MSTLTRNPLAATGKIWPMSVQAYHALGEMGLIPERTELLYGAVCHRTSQPLFRIAASR